MTALERPRVVKQTLAELAPEKWWPHHGLRGVSAYRGSQVTGAVRSPPGEGERPVTADSGIAADPTFSRLRRLGTPLITSALD
jgi:hypothetical protein